MRSSALIIGLMLVCSASALAATYRWVDRSGVVHYSDRPAPGAVLIETRQAQTFQSPDTSTGSSSATSANANSGATTQAPVQAYESLEIFRPASDETISNSGNIVSVRLRLEPDLRVGDSIWLYLDGKRVDGLPSMGTEFTLKDVWRGSHTVTAVVTDGQGKPLITSAGVTFHMHQNSVNRPRG